MKVLGIVGVDVYDRKKINTFSILSIRDEHEFTVVSAYSLPSGVEAVMVERDFLESLRDFHPHFMNRGRFRHSQIQVRKLFNPTAFLIRMSLKHQLIAQGFAPEHVPGGYQVLGDVMLTKFPPGAKMSVREKKSMAKALAELLPKVRVVCEIKGIGGELRKPSTAVLFSRERKPSLETVHTEHGIRFKLDPSKVMFSKGNLAERARLTSRVKPREVIIDMFAGIGYFSLGIAKAAPRAQIIAIEKNSAAFKYLKENIALNRTFNIRAVRGDCRTVRLRQKADRIVMGYFPGTEKFLKTAFRLLKPRAVIHYHNIYSEKEKRDRPVAELEQAAEHAGYKLVGVSQRAVKSYAPHVWHVVVDAEVEEKNRFKSFYDRTADIYDLRQQNPWTARLREAELALLAEHARGSVLDIGCGTGFHLAWLVQNKPECRLVGCDIAPEMLEAARKNVSCELVEGNAERLPFQDNSFDTVLCMFTTLNLCDHHAALAEMHRVLKQGGRAIISVSSIYDNSEKSEKRIRIEGSLLRLHLFKAAELNADIVKAGFSVARFDSLFRSSRPRWGDWSSRVVEDLRQPVDRGAMYLYVLEKKGGA